MIRFRRIIICAAGIIAVLVLVAAVYLSVYYHADESVDRVFEHPDIVSVTRTDGGYYLDGKGGSDVIVFYPGAKVEEEAYLPLLYEIAEKGVDCILLDMPFRLSVLDIDAVKDVIPAYDYDNWFLCGHSMGGAACAMYAQSHPEGIKGLILLAAYPTGTISDDMALLSIYGENDGVLNMKRYEEGRSMWPQNSKEVCIEGGNHAYFGVYGMQRGDNAASITNERQQEIAVEEIIRFCRTVFSEN